MEGVVSILDQANLSRVLTLWQELQDQCLIPQIYPHFIPHITWHVAESYNDEKLPQALEEIGIQHQRFSFKAAGFGIFSGEKPVVYISLVKERKLLEFHEQLWDKLDPFANQSNPYYSPGNWMPHITIFFDEIFEHLPDGWNSVRTSTCVLNYLIPRKIEWVITIDNLAYGRMDEELRRFQFSV